MTPMKSFSLAVPLLILLCSNAAFAERLTVMASEANVRSGPGKEHEVLWRVEKYHPIDILRKAGSWYYFSDFEGDTGWIHKSLVRKLESVITAKKASNIRSGPGTGYEILDTVESGVPFKVRGRKGNWLHVEHADGDRGWIHKSLVW